MPTAAATPLRVLVVARWYPSHDQPGRGSFVADLVTALVARDVEVAVASFEATHVRGVAATRPERGARAAAAIGPAMARPAARLGLNRPRSWGAAGVPVSRLPVFLDGERRRPGDVADGHAAVLLPFGVALAAAWPFDVIHAHTGLVDGVVAARLGEAVGRPLLVTEHSSTAAGELADAEAAALYRPLLGEGGGRPRRTVAVSRSLAGGIVAALGVPAEAVDVLPNAVPIDGFPLGADGARDPDELLFVGSRKASKGIERLLRALAIARRERPELRLRLVGPPGTGEEEAGWQALIADLGVAEAVRLEPAAPRADVAAAMRHAGLFVHPSPRETFGMVVAEALASGLPVVTTPSGGGDEIVGTDGRFGEVAAGFEPEDLAAAILRARGRRRPSEDAGAMRAHVEHRYASPSVAARTIEIYQELIAASGAPAASGTHAAAQPLALPPPDSRPVAVVALARGQAVQRFDLLPPDLRRATIVFTIPPAPSGLNAAQLPPLGTWHEADPRRETLAPGETARRLRDAVHGDGWLVALDADDVLAAESALGDGVDLAPGGLRWLADRWDEGRADEARR